MPELLIESVAGFLFHNPLYLPPFGNIVSDELKHSLGWYLPFK